MDDLAFLQYQVAAEEKLRKNDLFYEYEICSGRALLALQDNKIEFLSHGGSFFEDAFLKSIDESTGFIGCLKMGSFRASFHHSRALIELYATVSFCLSEEGQSKGMFERYERYVELELCRMARALESGVPCWDFSDSHKRILKETHLTPPLDALKAFGYQTMEKYEENLKVRTSKSWMGGITLSELLSKLEGIHGRNHEKSCNFTHFSALIKRSKVLQWGLPHWWEQLLMATAKYSLDIYIFLRGAGCFSETSIVTLDEIYLKLGRQLIDQAGKKTHLNQQA